MSFFEQAYEETPPWDIGRPQPEIVRLEAAGQITGSVLDVGCGTGEHVLFLGQRGHQVVGIDFVPAAIDKARAKARERGIAATFLTGDALDLQRLGLTFDTVIDSGLFHIFSDDQRPQFVRSLAQALRPGGKYHMLCFSEHEPGTYGPRRVRKSEIRAAFQDGWQVDEIVEVPFETNMDPRPVRAYRASITRLGKLAID